MKGYGFWKIRTGRPPQKQTLSYDEWMRVERRRQARREFDLFVRAAIVFTASLIVGTLLGFAIALGRAR